MEFTTRKEFLEAMDKGREEFLDVIDLFDSEDFDRPVYPANENTSRAWTTKDILIHVCLWEAELIKLMWQIKQGKKPISPLLQSSPAKVDQLNEQWMIEGTSRPLEFALEDFHAVRNQTLIRIEQFSDQDLFSKSHFPWLRGKCLAEVIAANTFEHESEHLAAVKHLKQDQP